VFCLGLALAGGFPFAGPPAHLKAGAGYANKRVPVYGKQTSHYPGMASIALDSASVTEQPIHIALGLTASVGNSGWYVESGWMHRLAPKWRLGVHGASEKLWESGGGYGLRTSLTLEYTSRFRREAGSEYDAGNDGTHNQTTTYSAQSGSWAIGAFLDAGHRWMERDPDTFYVMFGVSIRLPAYAGAVDVSGQH